MPDKKENLIRADAFLDAADDSIKCAVDHLMSGGERDLGFGIQDKIRHAIASYRREIKKLLNKENA